MSGFDYGKKLPDGQHERHPSLPAEARQQFVRPVRTRYKHVGARPARELRPLTAEEKERFGSDWAGFEEYPPGQPNGATGRFWTAKELASGCGTVTQMGLVLAETYAARPTYYGKTFCAHCHDYFKVGPDGEFTWVEQDGRDGPLVGT